MAVFTSYECSHCGLKAEGDPALTITRHDSGQDVQAKHLCPACFQLLWNWI